MAMDSNVKPLPFNVKPLPFKGTRTSGAVIAPDGTAWVAARDAGAVYSVLANDPNKLVPHKLPADIPHDRGSAQPSHIALELRSNAVAAVWVSDHHTGYAYRLDPKDPTGKNAKKVDLGPGSILRGIAWDAKRKLVWVADENGRLLAIDADRIEEKKDLAVSNPRSETFDVAVTDGGVWFTECAAGNICFLDASKDPQAEDRVTRLSFGITAPDGKGGKVPGSYPTGLAVDGPRVWVVSGLAGSSEGNLWFADNVAKPALHHVKKLGTNTLPSDIAVDAAGYLWITLSGVHKAVQLTNTGLQVVEYDLTADTLPTDIAYAAHQDQIWICDGKKENQRALRLTPIDKIEPAKTGELAITGNPPKGFVAQGKQLSPFEISILDKDSGEGAERHVVLSIDPPDVGSFAGQTSTIVKTDSSGKATVNNMLKVAADATHGAQFKIHAMTRGLRPPAVVYEGRVGEPIAGINAVDDVEETVTFGADFKNLEAQVMMPGGQNAGEGTDVVFKIESGELIADFGEGERAVSEYPVITDDRGIARAGLRALQRAGNVKVSAHTKLMGPSLSASFKPRHVVPLPDAIEGSDTMSITVGQPSAPYTMTVVAGDRKAPIPHVVVEIVIIILDPGASGVHFESTHEHPIDPKHLKVRIRTNEKGQVTIGKGHEWYIVSPTPGNVKVTFDVIEPSGATASKDITAGVMSAS